MDFLTLEDINSVLGKYRLPFWDSVEISTGDSDDFTNIKFNYINVRLRQYDNDDNYLFELDVDNDLKTGNFYFTTKDGEYLESVGRYSNNVIYVNSHSPDIIVYSELWAKSTTQSSFEIAQFNIKSISPNVSVIQDNIDVVVELEPIDPSIEDFDGFEFTIKTDLEDIVVVCENNKLEFQLPYSNGYSFQITGLFSSTTTYQIIPIKNINIIDLPNNLVLIDNKINTFDVISDSTNLKVESEYPCSNDGDSINIDLSSKTDHKPVKLIVKTVEDDYYYPNVYVFNIPCEIEKISNISQLNSLIENGGEGILENNIQLTNNLNIDKDIVILGDNHSIDLNGYNITVKEDRIFKSNDTSLVCEIIFTPSLFML